MNRNTRRIGISISLIMALVLLGLTVMLLHAKSPAAAQTAAELQVCMSGCDFTSIQAAVDAASNGDIIKVADGTYSDLHDHAAPLVYYGPSVVRQVVYVDKNITLRGGYSTSDWDVSDPLANPTIIDASGGGRALVIVGEATIEGFHLTGGDARDLRGSDRAGGATDAGGGVFIIDATPTLNNCQIYGNTAHQGGGVYVDRTAATLNANAIYANTANWGGGATLWGSDATLTGNTITGNTVVQSGAPGPPDVFISAGGGLEIGNDGGVDSYPTLIGNTISGNSAEKHGGGLALSAHVHANIHQNTISANTAITGGGLYLMESDAQITENFIADNTATNCGGGMSLWDSQPWIQSNDVYSNTTQGSGGGIHAYSTDFGDSGGPWLFGNQIRHNTAYGGGGVFLEFETAAVIGNVFEGNAATGGGGGVAGGGIFLLVSDATVDRNEFKFNTAERGGALGFQGGNAKIYNNLIYDNQASQCGNAVYTFGASPYLAHNTIAYNSGGDGSAICATYWEPFDQAWDIVNTIIYGESVGINASGAITIHLDHVLWYNTPVTVTTDGTATILAQNQLTDNPLFVYPDTRDFHLTAGSPARDGGMAMPDVLEDIDWQSRPMGWGYDIGADEYPDAALEAVQYASDLVVNPSETVAYTLVVSNTGAADATNVTLLNTLDPQQRALTVEPAGTCSITDGGWGGQVSCALGTMAPGAMTTVTLTAQVDPDIGSAQIMLNAFSVIADQCGSEARMRTFSSAVYTLDAIVVQTEPSAGNAVTRLEAGELDIYAAATSDPDLVQQITDAPTLAGYRTYGLYNELTFNPAGPIFAGTGKLNPFAIPRVREAMNRLVDREYIKQQIMGGLSVPRWHALNTVSRDYALLADVTRALELEYAYNKTLAQQTIAQEMLALGATL
ncbi:MAG: NosD domain-containing protein, partial [Anaerolineae bacterium]